MNKQYEWVLHLLFCVQTTILFNAALGAPQRELDLMWEIHLELQQAAERLFNEGKLNTREFKLFLEVERVFQIVN